MYERNETRRSGRDSQEARYFEIVNVNLHEVKKYARILPRPTEVFGQPLSIVSQRTGVAARIIPSVPY
jgi:hypothetical protein